MMRLTWHMRAAKRVGATEQYGSGRSLRHHWLQAGRLQVAPRDERLSHTVVRVGRLAADAPTCSCMSSSVERIAATVHESMVNSRLR
jgi:hypothetical protein